MRCVVALAAAWLGACGASDNVDPGPECSMFITFNQLPTPIGLPPEVRANATVQGATIFQYTWTVTHVGIGSVSHAPAQPDNSAIVFTAHVPGEYRVRLAVDADACVDAEATFFLTPPGAPALEARLRVVPPASANMPPYEKAISITGGAPTFPLGTLLLDPGRTVSAVVRSGATPVPAYLRLMPVTGKGAAVELFTDSAGELSARLLDQPHDVLVIPTVPGYAPQLVAGFVPGAPTIGLITGNTVTGTVLGPSGAPLAGAKVQLTILEIPSTLATTAADGTFSLRTVAPPGATVSVDVAPPEGSGLPRLLASNVELPPSLQIRYASTIALRNLAGTTIRRQGAPVPGARVVVVGTAPVVGTVTGAVLPVDGIVRIAATADAGGVLPAVLAPARSLSAVVEVAPNDHAVAALDLTSGTPAAIDAPPAVSISTQIRLADMTPVADAVLDAFPAGPLAWAGVASAIRARSGAGGQVTASLASGGRYELWFHDPVLARGAKRAVPDQSAQTILASYSLNTPLAVTGKLKLQGPSEAPLGGAVVQLLCTQCNNLERNNPFAEGTSQADGSFSLVVFDPGP